MKELRHWPTLAENAWPIMGESPWPSLGENTWPVLGQSPWPTIARKMTPISYKVERTFSVACRILTLSVGER